VRLATAAAASLDDAPAQDAAPRRRDPLSSAAAAALVRPAIEGFSTRAKALPLGLRSVDDSLPEGGLPRGAVVELAAPQGLARATTLALSLCASAQAEARLRGERDTRGAWCAWLDPTATLFAPAVARAGVDLDRLLVVRPTLDDLARVAARVASSHAFAVVVVDTAGVPGQRGVDRLDRWGTVTRRLALAIEGSDTTVLLLTDARASRAMPLPAAMRIEVERLAEDRLGLRVAKDRRGRVTPPQSIEMPRSA
jgi:recombination protein RecA